MSCKINNSIFGNLFYLVGNNFRNNSNLFSKYNEKFILRGTDFSGELSYKKINIKKNDIKIDEIQSEITIKNDSSKIWFVEKYVIKSHNNNIIEKHNIKKILHDPSNIKYIYNTEYKDLPKELFMKFDNNTVKDILSVRFSK
jgi:hypothetical protein